MKKVLVTGANSGFGYLIALTFARKGYKVFATTRSLEKEGVKKLNETASKEDLNIQWLVLDVTNEEQIQKAVKEVEKEGLDVLVNNAGFGILGPIQSYKIEDFQKQFDTNFFGVVRMVYAFLPVLLKSKSARIINISSIAGLIVAPAYAIYSSSKFALEAFTEALRYELFQSNVKVSLIEPGGFDTDFSINAKGLSSDEIEKFPKWYIQLRKLRNRFVGSFGNTKNKVRDPQKVANLVYRVASRRNPRLRNVIGSGAPISAILRKLTPGWLWEWSATKLLKIGMRMK